MTHTLLFTVLRCALWVLVAAGFDLGLCLLTRSKLRVRPLLPYVAFILTVDICHRVTISVAALLVYLFYDQFPWNRWGKKLGSKLSSLTDVTRAALKREQAEAFQ